MSGSTPTVAEMGGSFAGGPDSVQWLRAKRASRLCQVCGHDDAACWCPRFHGEPHMECLGCGALEGQHLPTGGARPYVCPP